MKLGNIDVTPIFELIASDVISDVISKATPESIKKIDWLLPYFADAKGNIKAVNQSFLLRTPSGNVLIDTCVGNGRKRPELPAWQDLDTKFFEKLQKHIKPEEVDYVICTHLHFDHIGWNTIEKDGKWIPAFQNAQYVFVKDEYDYWVNTPEKELIDDLNGIEESIEPLAKANLVKLVDSDAQITNEIELIPSPGHTPHHVSVLVESEGQTVLFAGDVFHHPCQIVHPEWMSFDTDEKQALKSRQNILNTYANTETVVIGAHFSEPYGGKIVKDSESYKLLPYKDDTSAKYEMVQEDYDNINEAFHGSYDTTKELKDQIESFCKRLKPGDTVLNVGGTLPECKYFVDKGFKVTNIDISQPMLDHIAKNEQSVENVHCNIKDFSVKKFNGIWACRSLIHIPPQDIDDVLKNIHSLLEDEGVFGSVFFTTDRGEIVEEEKPEWQSKKKGTMYYRVLYPTIEIGGKIGIRGIDLGVKDIVEVTDLDGDKGVYVEAVKHVFSE